MDSNWSHGRAPDSALDRAILEHRASPTEENKQRVLRLQAAHAQDFYDSQAASFVERGRDA